MTSPTLAPLDTALASPGQRIGGRIVDIVVWILMSAIVNAMLGVNAFDTRDDDVASIAIASLISATLIVVYEVVMTTVGGGTLGKRLAFTRVVSESGSPPTTAQMLSRMSTYVAAAVIGIAPAIGVLASVINLLVGLTSLVLLFRDDRCQAVWDRIARTLVVAK